MSTTLFAMQCQWSAQGTQWAHRFALKLVGEYHGSLCKRIAEALLKHGTQSLDELAYTCNIQTGYEERPRIKKDDVKLALIYLLQMNLVNAYLRTDGSIKGEETLYEAALDRMLQIVRQVLTPRFISHIRVRFSDQPNEYEAIITVLLEHGKLRADQIVKHAATDLEAKGINPSPQQLSMILQTLISQRYIEAAPPCDLPPPPKELHINAQKKRGSSSSAAALNKELHKDEDANRLIDDSARHRDKASWVRDRFLWSGLPSPDIHNNTTDEEDEDGGGPSQKDRKRRRRDVLIDSEEEDDQEEAVNEAAATNGNNKNKKPTRGKGKRNGKTAAGSLEVEIKEEEDDKEATDAANGGDNPSNSAAWINQLTALGLPRTIWRVNYDEFNRQFRNVEILQITSRGHDNMCVAIMKSILDAGGSLDHSPKSPFTPPISLETIYQGVKKEMAEVTYQEVVEAIHMNLVDDEADLSGTFVSRHSEGPGGANYKVNVEICIGEARRLYVLSAIRERFGESAARIWEMLFIEGQLEQKAVAEKAMVPKEEAREALYSMLRAGYISMQDVPRSADHAPSRTFYTFRAEISAAVACLAIDMYRAAGNVHRRLCAHVAANSIWTEKIALVTSGQLDKAALENDEFRSFKKALNVLQGSLLRLDQQIALFNDM